MIIPRNFDNMPVAELAAMVRELRSVLAEIEKRERSLGRHNSRVRKLASKTLIRIWGETAAFESMLKQYYPEGLIK